MRTSNYTPQIIENVGNQRVSNLYSAIAWHVSEFDNQLKVREGLSEMSLHS